MGLKEAKILSSSEVSICDTASVEQSEDPHALFHKEERRTMKALDEIPNEVAERIKKLYTGS